MNNEKQLQTAVFYRFINGVKEFENLHPEERNKEVKECASLKVKTQKYCAWKLLESAVNRLIDCDFNQIDFKKTNANKWVCENFYFSIAHSESLVAVAVSPLPIGLDCEKFKPFKEEVAGKILNEQESEIYSSLPQSARQEFLLKTWCKKESLLKQAGEKNLYPKTRNTLNAEFCESEINKIGERFYLCACGDGVNKNTKIIEL